MFDDDNTIQKFQAKHFKSDNLSWRMKGVKGQQKMKSPLAGAWIDSLDKGNARRPPLSSRHNGNVAMTAQSKTDKHA